MNTSEDRLAYVVASLLRGYSLHALSEGLIKQVITVARGIVAEIEEKSHAESV
ncbi:MAG: hypothetical protein ABSF66_00840 [Terriglobales bacterium]|jgi:hypothetical protein